MTDDTARLARIEAKQDETLKLIGGLSSDLKVEIAGGAFRQRQIDELRNDLEKTVSREEFRDFRDGVRRLQWGVVLAIVSTAISTFWRWMTNT